MRFTKLLSFLKKHIIALLAIAACLAAAFILHFTLRGYEVLALAFLALAFVIFLFILLSVSKSKLAFWCRIILIALLVLATVLSVIAGVPIIREASKREKADSPYCIVLGCSVHGTAPSWVLSNRIEAAYQFLTEHPDTVAVLSGGQGRGEDISEAQCMFDRLVQKGIDPDRLIREDKSTSTRENFRFSYALIRERSPEVTSITVISSETHLYRAQNGSPVRKA